MEHKEVTLRFDLSLEDYNDYTRNDLANSIIEAVRVEIGHYLPELKEFKVWMEY